MIKSTLPKILFITIITIFLITSFAFPEDALFVNDNGNVGIGTSDPGVKLDVSGEANITSKLTADRLELGTNSISSTSDITLKANAIIGGESSLSFGVEEGGYYRWYTGITDSAGGYAGGTERMRLDSSGNVGIGTSGPSKTLSVVSLGGSSGGIAVRESDDGNDAIHLFAGSTSGYIDLNKNGSRKIRLYSGGNSYFNGGNVGIGTTSPEQRLHVSGGLLVHYPTSNTNLYLRNSGGTNNSLIWWDDSTGGHDYYLGQVNENDDWRIYNYAAGEISLRVYNSGNVGISNNRLYIVDSGKVGIGTTSPGDKLDVNGNVRCTALVGPSGGGGIIRTLNNNYNISFDQVWEGYANVLKIYSSGGLVKTFVIDHPLDESKYLVHGTLEGPEAAVYYRGSGRIENGETEIELPPYFEALTREGGRTVMLTNIDGFDRLMVKKIDGKKIKDGKFIVVSENEYSDQEFDWEVKAIRKDVPLLEVEPYRDDIVVRGNGPYTYAIPKEEFNF